VQIAVHGRYGLEQIPRHSLVSAFEATRNNRQRVLIDMRRFLGRLDVAECPALGAVLAKLVRLKTAILATPEVLGAQRPRDPIVRTEAVAVRAFQSEGTATGWLAIDAAATAVVVPVTRMCRADEVGSLPRLRGS
jgi:hypothetical protein